MSDSSPMIEQYRRIKREHRDDVLFFRLGDFYEMFAEDALEISALLNLTLTSRNGVPMCGIPYHAARSYIARLLRCGKKIAVCEQVSEPTPGKGLVDRRVVEVITPGTTVEEDYLDKGSFNYLAAFASAKDGYSFAYIDLSTGDFQATAFPEAGGGERLRRELERIQAKELIVQESLLEERKELAEAILDRSALVVNRWADWLFDLRRGQERLERQFGTANLKGFGLGEDAAEIVAAAALLDYLDDTARSLLPHVRGIRIYGEADFVGIDEASQRNLELVRNLRDGEPRFSLLEVMDETRTAMGRRNLKQRILHPLCDVDRINARLDSIDLLYHDQSRLAELREILGKAPDLERLCARIAMDRAHARDLAAAATALDIYEKIDRIAREIGLRDEPEARLVLTLDPSALERLRGVRELLDRGIREDPSILLTEGNIIRDGFNAELDALRDLRDNGRGLLEAYLEEERAATGIANLKIRYNRLIGYFFEVNNNSLSQVPVYFIRRQGVAGGERYTTDRLAGLESDINGATDRVVELEKKLFLGLRDQAKALIPEMMAAAKRIAAWDVGQSLARAATVRAWVRPVVAAHQRLRIIEGRHPVVEAHLARGEFVPNDLDLDAAALRFALITGPNMAGKSTYLRQAALICLMAQTGSFVPAQSAEIGIVDRIFCRVGASDNLARGESTFLVEMNETAHILHSATQRSLVIMDEVGRGTGTNDGLSLAWAVCEELLDGIGCRTLFATHFHELSRLSHPGLAHRSMEVLEQDGEIVFIRKIREGAAAESYGLHVARLAGLGDRVVQRAAYIMDRLREKELVLQDTVPAAVPQNPIPAAPENPRLAEIIKDLAFLDVDRLTPLEALNRIHGWRRSLSNTKSASARIKNRPQVEKGLSLFD